MTLNHQKNKKTVFTSSIFLPTRRNLLLAACGFCLALAERPASAAIYTWDPSATTTGSDGSGTWDNVTSIWANGGVDTTFPSVDTTTVAAARAYTGVANGNATFTVTDNTGLAVGQYVSLTQFPAGTYISSITGSGPYVITMSANATGASASGTANFMAGNAVVFGSNSGAAGTVTVAGTQKAAYMTINPAASGNYTFTGGIVNLVSGTNSANGAGTLFLNDSATFDSTGVLRALNITFGAANKTLTLAGGSGAGNLLANNGNYSGTTGAIAQSSTVNLTAGTYAFGGFQSVNIGSVAAGTGGVVINSGVTYNTAASTFQIGSGGAGGNGLMRVNGGTLNISTSGSVIGRSAGNSGRLILDSGAVNIAATANSATDANMRVGFQGGVGRLDVNGGTLTAGGYLAINDPFNTGTGSTGNVVNITGGTATFGSILMGGSNSALTATTGSAALNVSGGALYLGTANTATTTTPAGTLTPNGIMSFGAGTSTYAVNLSGGTVGATANWSSAVNMNLSNTNGGISFKTASEANVAHDITLSGVLSGTGGMTKTGGGLLTLSGINTYSGNTLVSEGSFTLASTGGLSFSIGASGVNNAITVSPGAALLLSGDFSFTLVDPLATSGTWTIVNASSLAGVFGSSFDVSSAGWLETAPNSGIWNFNNYTFSEATGVLTAVPEPSTWALLSLGTGVLLFLRKRNRSIAQKA